MIESAELTRIWLIGILVAIIPCCAIAGYIIHSDDDYSTFAFLLALFGPVVWFLAIPMIIVFGITYGFKELFDRRSI